MLLVYLHNMSAIQRISYQAAAADFGIPKALGFRSLGWISTQRDI